jgi:hypothetical protein
LPPPQSARLGRLAAVKSRTAARHARERAGVEARIEQFMQGQSQKIEPKKGSANY